MNNPLISVIMSIFNENDNELKMSIDSILQQTYSNFEFIIVWDNPKSIDGFNKLKRLVEQDARVKVIFNKENLGLALSLNKAFSYSKGEYIARMDADDVSIRSRFYEQIEYFRENPNTDLLSSEGILIDENNKKISHYVIPRFGRDNFKKAISIQNFLLHPTWMMKRKVFSELSGYRPFPSSQDYDFILRVLDKGYSIDTLHKKLLLYRVRAKGISQSNLLRQAILASYIKELHRRRLKTGEDFFSIEELKNILNNISVKDINSYKQYIQSFQKQNPQLFIGLIKSSVFRGFVWDSIRMKLLKKFSRSC